LTRLTESAVLIGYFPKRTAHRPEWLQAAPIDEVCSVSECISEGPEGWIDAWKHNACWVYDTPELAASVVPEGEEGFEVYAYRQVPVCVADGEVRDEPPAEVDAAPLTDEFEWLGYDAVSRSISPMFECSPLSCCGAAESMPVNRHCLFETLEQALAGAREFSSGPWEPGPYLVVEVYRRRRACPPTEGPAPPPT
jgi:hypothetical protein